MTTKLKYLLFSIVAFGLLNVGSSYASNGEEDKGTKVNKSPSSSIVSDTKEDEKSTGSDDTKSTKDEVVDKEKAKKSDVKQSSSKKSSSSKNNKKKKAPKKKSATTVIDGERSDASSNLSLTKDEVKSLKALLANFDNSKSIVVSNRGDSKTAKMRWINKTLAGSNEEGAKVLKLDTGTLTISAEDVATVSKFIGHIKELRNNIGEKDATNVIKEALLDPSNPMTTDAINILILLNGKINALVQLPQAAEGTCCYNCQEGYAKFAKATDFALLEMTKLAKYIPKYWSIIEEAEKAGHQPVEVVTKMLEKGAKDDLTYLLDIAERYKNYADARRVAKVKH